jgi:hypothetical protein
LCDFIVDICVSFPIHIPESNWKAFSKAFTFRIRLKIDGNMEKSTFFAGNKDPYQHQPTSTGLIHPDTDCMVDL